MRDYHSALARRWGCYRFGHMVLVRDRTYMMNRFQCTNSFRHELPSSRLLQRSQASAMVGKDFPPGLVVRIRCVCVCVLRETRDERTRSDHYNYHFRYIDRQKSRALFPCDFVRPDMMKSLWRGVREVLCQLSFQNAIFVQTPEIPCHVLAPVHVSWVDSLIDASQNSPHSSTLPLGSPASFFILPNFGAVYTVSLESVSLTAPIHR